MWNLIRNKFRHGNLTIKDVTKAVVPAPFRGLPKINAKAATETQKKELVALCPTGAIGAKPLSIDLGKCIFCGDCARHCPAAIQFTNFHKLGTTSRKHLIVDETTTPEKYVKNAIESKKAIQKLFGRSLKLRQVSAAGNNADEFELNACVNVNFDMGRFGIDWVASPRHADGIVITGPISENMAKPLEDCYHSVPDPKIVILAGTSAISGGIFQGSKALDRSFLDKYKIDLYIPGDPVHPLTFVNAVLAYLNK